MRCDLTDSLYEYMFKQNKTKKRFENVTVFSTHYMVIFRMLVSTLTDKTVCSTWTLEPFSEISKMQNIHFKTIDYRSQFEVN